MLKQETVIIDGDTYLLTAFPATKGIRYQKKLAKILLPAFSEIMKARESSSDDGEFGEALDRLSDHIDELDEDMVREMVEIGATKGGVQIKFDYEFSTEYGKLFKLFREIVRFNFSSVFTGLGSAASDH